MSSSTRFGTSICSSYPPLIISIGSNFVVIIYVERIQLINYVGHSIEYSRSHLSLVPPACFCDSTGRMLDFNLDSNK
jgi:hypothetical protein